MRVLGLVQQFIEQQRATGIYEPAAHVRIEAFTLGFGISRIWQAVDIEENPGDCRSSLPRPPSRE
jgi:hypothetical protein